MNFSQALMYLKLGKKLKREGWNGKNLYVEAFKDFVCGDMFIIVNIRAATINSWVPSVSDLYADDWEVEDFDYASIK